MPRNDYLTRRHRPSVLGLAGITSLMAGMTWLGGQMLHVEKARAKRETDVDEAMEESFPASDPPVFGSTTDDAPEVSNVARLRTVH